MARPGLYIDTLGQSLSNSVNEYAYERMLYVEAAAVIVSEEDKHVNIDHLQVEPKIRQPDDTTLMGSSCIFISSQAPSGVSSVSIVIARVLTRSCSSSRTFNISNM